jgi:hypothetical protein
MMKALVVIAAFGAVDTLATPARAMDGRTALDQCTANPKCRVHLDADGGMVIQVGGHVIYCPPQGLGECEIVYRRGGKHLVGKDLPMATAAGTDPAATALSPERLLKN